MKNNLLKSKLPQRAASHRTDTRALRLIMSQLNEDWVIRNLEERDYGIDLQLELFDGDNPTGYMALVQVKGTEKSFSEELSAKIPVSTLHYAELFNIPFFLFRTSLFDGETEFIWLQKYISTDLVILNPKWRAQTDLSIRIPDLNKLSSNEKKFRGIVMAQRYDKDGLSFAKNADALRRFLMDALLQTTGKSNAICCLECVRELKRLIPFLTIKDNQGTTMECYWNTSLPKVEEILLKLIAKPKVFKLFPAHAKAAKELLYALDQTMHSYLLGDDTYRAFVHANKKTKGKFPVKPPF